MLNLYRKDILLQRWQLMIAFIVSAATAITLAIAVPLNTTAALLASSLIFFILALAGRIVNTAEHTITYMLLTLPVQLRQIISSKYLLGASLALGNLLWTALVLWLGSLLTDISFSAEGAFQGILLGLSITLLCLGVLLFTYFVFHSYLLVKLLLIPVIFISSYSSAIVHSPFMQNIVGQLQHISLTTIGSWSLLATVGMYGISYIVTLQLAQRRDW